MTHQPADPVVLTGLTDLDVARSLAEVRRERPDSPVIAVFAEQETADVYRADESITAVAWAPTLAREIAAAAPPSPLGTVSPPPVVVGDGMVARHVVAAYVEGWSDPGQPLEVYCLGANPAWVQEADEVTRPRGQLLWTQVVPRPVPVVRRVREHIAAWPEPKEKNASLGAVAVVVALEAPDATLSVAAAIASQVPGARVAAVVLGEPIWPAVAGVQVFSVLEAQAGAARGSRSATERVVDLLLADIAWVADPAAKATAPEEPAFAPLGRGDDGQALPWKEQPQQVRDQVQTLVDALAGIFAEGSIALDRSGVVEQPIVSTPGELRAMAGRILDLLGVEATPRSLLTALELAFRLPAIAGRAGWTCRRPEKYRPLLSFDQVETLAPLVHLAYQEVSVQTDYASKSPVAHQLWEELTEFLRASNRAALVGSAVGHAALGLDWSVEEGATPRTWTAEQVERLAELEHRRWAINQRRNGANDHAWMLPWNGQTEDDHVSDDVKKYDYHIVREVPRILATMNLALN